MLNEGGGNKIFNLAFHNESSSDLENLEWVAEGLYYNYDDDRVKIGTLDPGGGGPLSIVVRANFSGTKTRHNQLIAKRDGWDSADMRWQFARNNTADELKFESKDFSSGFEKTLLSGEHQYVLTTGGSGNTPSLYIDNDSGTSGSAGVTFGSDTTAALCIGNVGDATPGEGFDGIISLVTLYERVLTFAEIAQLYAEPYCSILVPQYWYMVDFGAGAGGTTTVNSDLTLVYDLLNTAQSDLTAKFDVLNRINSDLTFVYDMAGRVQSDLTCLYDMAGIVQSDLTARFDILNRIQSDFTALFDILSTVQADLTAVYDIANRITSDLTALFDVRGIARSDLTAVYDMAGKVRSDLTLLFRILEDIDLSRYGWNNLPWGKLAWDEERWRED
ncbi:MAG: hypothetical protein JRJ69_14090 [Deltaproteobacteria bacterium]|nr:hypothetical protein [Deltaproteobacteria bacterium]